MAYVGSYGNSLDNNVNDGSYDQDYLGGHLVNSDYIMLIGNAWKAFQLETPYEITKNTRISFDFTILKEAQGHAICLDDDRNEDTFGGTHIRCLMLGGKQLSAWDHVKKVNLVDLKEGIARQSSTSGEGSDAMKAVDGNIKQAYSRVPQLNSVSSTRPEINPWWEFEFGCSDYPNWFDSDSDNCGWYEDGTNNKCASYGDDYAGINDLTANEACCVCGRTLKNDEAEFDISEIILYSGFNCPSCEDLVNFRVSVCGSSTSNTPSKAPSSSPHPSTTQVPTTWPDACEDSIYTRIGDDIRSNNTVNQDGIFIIPVDKRGAKIRITLEGSTPRVLALGEVQVIGKLAEGVTTPIDLNVFDLFPGQDANIRYIGFVQDDDKFPNTGRPPHIGDGAVVSTFKDIIIYEEGDESTQVVSCLYL